MIGNLTILSLREIARIIAEDWPVATKRGSTIFGDVAAAHPAGPYLAAMGTLDNINQPYGLDSGKSCVLYFLANSQSWRGETARAVKKELRRRAELS